MFTRDGGTRWATLIGVSLFAAPFVGLVATDDPPAGSAVRAVAAPSGPAARDDRAGTAPRVVTTTVPPTTTTSAPPTTTTTAAPAPPTTAAPPPPAAISPEARADAAFLASVPAGWRAVVPVDVVIIGGSTSWSFPSGRIEVSASHTSRGPVVLATTIAHEFGHLIAWRYGSQAFNGAAPDGWPAFSGQPSEAWSDCVAYAFTGNPEPSHGLPACPAASLDWTRSWLAAGPAAHPRTG